MEVVIVGGGLAGLTNALTLQKSGITARVYEATREYNVPSTGIVLGYNALAVLEALGVKDEVVSNGVPVEHLYIANTRLGTIKSNLLNGMQYGSPLISIEHNTLLKILENQLNPGTILKEKVSKGFLSKKGGISIIFGDNTVVEAQTIVAADGGRSTLRKYIYHNLVFRYPKITSWKGTTTFNLPQNLRNSYVEVWGKGLRFGFVPIAGDKVSWYASVHAKPGYKHKTQKHTQQALSLFEKFASPIPDLIRSTDANNIFWKDIYDFPPLSHWHRGRICMIGDAAHPITPGMEQGASLAIEDGYVLGRALATEKTPKDAYRKFQSLRKSKTDVLIHASWFAGKIIHSRNPLINRMSIIGASFLPKKIYTSYLKKIFTINYPVK